MVAPEVSFLGEPSFGDCSAAWLANSQGASSQRRLHKSTFIGVDGADDTRAASAPPASIEAMLLEAMNDFDDPALELVYTHSCKVVSSSLATSIGWQTIGIYDTEVAVDESLSESPSGGLYSSELPGSPPPRATATCSTVICSRIAPPHCTQMTSIDRSARITPSITTIATAAVLEPSQALEPPSGGFKRSASPGSSLPAAAAVHCINSCSRIVPQSAEPVQTLSAVFPTATAECLVVSTSTADSVSVPQSARSTPSPWMSWSRSFPGSSVRAAPGVEDQFTPGDRPSTGRLRYS